MIRQNTVFQTHAAEKAPLGTSSSRIIDSHKNLQGVFYPCRPLSSLGWHKIQSLSPSLLQHKNHVNIHSALPK
jgi:hypothetical protein